MSDNTKLPLRQYVLDKFLRFGLSQFANHFPKEIDTNELLVLVAAVLAPTLATVGAIVALITHCTIEVERDNMLPLTK